RNVNEGIWQIKRLDRWNGQTIPVTGEFGGAAAPSISPDGGRMAYVRRVRAKTILELMDLASGKIRTVAEGVQRDNQEGVCFHGVFPGSGGTPAGWGMVAPAEGKIWRYGASRNPVPFRAKVEQTLTEALRTPRRIGTDEVAARIIRWPVETRDGKTLV